MDKILRIFSNKNQERKEIRYEDLTRRFDNGEELTEQELNESTQLYYELHPEEWDSLPQWGTKCSPKEVYGQNTEDY